MIFPAFSKEKYTLHINESQSYPQDTNEKIKIFNKASNKQIHADVPKECVDINRNFLPVKNLANSLVDNYTSYKKGEFIFENEKGFIREDFNTDKFDDYMFIEVSKNNNQARFVSCISHSATSWYRDQVFNLINSTSLNKLVSLRVKLIKNKSKNLEFNYSKENKYYNFIKFYQYNGNEFILKSTHYEYHDPDETTIDRYIDKDYINDTFLSRVDIADNSWNSKGWNSSTVIRAKIHKSHQVITMGSSLDQLINHEAEHNKSSNQYYKLGMHPNNEDCKLKEICIEIKKIN